MCELWRTDQPPDLLEYTTMGNLLDDVVGFHLSEEELMEAYDMESMDESALYLFNLMRTVESEEEREDEKSGQKSVRKAKRAE
jgi:hypothetical protein